MVASPLFLALTESSVVSLTTTIAGVVGGVVLGLLVYIWRSNVAGFREALDRTDSTLEVAAERLQEIDKAKADRAELVKVVEDMRLEQRENQARYVFLNETLTNALGAMRADFARNSECAVKHSGLQESVQSVSLQLRENKQVLQDLAKKLDLILEWKAYKSGEEQGRKDR